MKNPFVVSGLMEKSLTKQFHHSFPLILSPDFSDRREEWWEEAPKLAYLLPTCCGATYNKQP
jgi:hypothetical protein